MKPVPPDWEEYACARGRRELLDRLWPYLFFLSVLLFAALFVVGWWP